MKSVITDCQYPKDQQYRAEEEEKKCPLLEDSAAEEEVIAFDIRDKTATSERPVVSYAFRDGAITSTRAESVPTAAGSGSGTTAGAGSGTTAGAGVSKGPWTISWVCWQLYAWSRCSPEHDDATLEITRAINGIRPSKNTILWLLFANLTKGEPVLTLCSVILADRVDGRVLIRSLCVNPALTGRGYGTAAVSLFVRSPVNNPVLTEECLVIVVDQKARFFWERLGWFRRRQMPWTDDAFMINLFQEAWIKNAAVYSYA
jgi:RimJ/RimL family protein N-acetyltransferase